MPELPDVEGFRRFFARFATGKRVRHVWSDRAELRNTSPSRLGRALTGRSFSTPRRHGKWLIWAMDGDRGRPNLLLHFGMAAGSNGSLVPAPAP